MEQEGYRVEKYKEGDYEMDGLMESKKNIEILDIKMKRMEGMEIMRRMRKK